MALRLLPSDTVTVAVQKLARMIGEFKKRYHEQWKGTEPDTADNADAHQGNCDRGTIHDPIMMRFCLLRTSGR